MLEPSAARPLSRMSWCRYAENRNRRGNLSPLRRTDHHSARQLLPLREQCALPRVSRQRRCSRLASAGTADTFREETALPVSAGLLRSPRPFSAGLTYCPPASGKERPPCPGWSSVFRAGRPAGSAAALRPPLRRLPVPRQRPVCGGVFAHSSPVCRLPWPGEVTIVSPTYSEKKENDHAQRGSSHTGGG